MEAEQEGYCAARNDIFPPSVPNAACVILGTPARDAMTIVGPFATADDAGAYVREQQQKNPQVAAMSDVLVAPENRP